MSLLLTFLLKTYVEAGYEMRFPEGANMITPGRNDALWEAFVYWSSINPNRFYREGKG
jgi:hypothetical protein